MNNYQAHPYLDMPPHRNISLSKRETEVLADYSCGLSRNEIAASRDISANTVKMVVFALFEKLRANNMPDAVRIAVQRKII